MSAVMTTTPLGDTVRIFNFAAAGKRSALEQQLATEGARLTAIERRLLLDVDIPPEQRAALEGELEAALPAYQVLCDEWWEQQEREQGVRD